MGGSRTVAVFRLEGPLIKKGTLAVSAFYAANAQRFSDRLLSLARVAASAPLLTVLGQEDRGFGNRLAYSALRDMSRDRVEVLAEEYAETYLRDAVLERGRDLLREARKAGHEILLLAETTAEIVDEVRSLFEPYGALVTNRLEYRSERATGRLERPIIGGHESARWLRDYAAEHDVDLTRSVAYASHGADLLLLSAVGRPCAVNPDHALRRAAREVDWPILEYQA